MELRVVESAPERPRDWSAIEWHMRQVASSEPWDGVEDDGGLWILHPASSEVQRDAAWRAIAANKINPMLAHIYQLKTAHLRKQ